MYGTAIEKLLGGSDLIGHEIRNEMDLYEQDTGIYHIPVEFIFLIKEV